ncbi:MAG TPA: bifunctional nuclease family protein [Firmicutes bacterium]|nr:bifunctional nuclease family protein [Bacillota bacterium]
MIPVKVREVVLDQVQNPLLLLVDIEESMVLPIGIGFWEAQAIVLKLQGHVPPRPLTHDLFKALCSHLGASVEKVIINDIRKSTFFAEIYLTNSAQQEVVVDARPSDAVALALTVGCPIYITKNVAAYTVSIKDLLEEQKKEPSGFGEPDEGGPHLH